MSTNFSPPPFPLPLVSVETANPASSATGAAFYLVMNPAQGSLQIPIPGRTLFPPPPTFPMPLGQANNVTPSSFPSYHPQALHSTVSELTQTAPDGRGSNQDYDKYEDDGGEYRYPERRAKSPPSRPFYSGASRNTRTSPSRLAKFFSAVFRIPRPSRRTYPPAPIVREPQLPAFRCRYPVCTNPVRSDEAARLGGFCGDTHMLRAIQEGIAVQCPGCQQRVCPEGWNFCSAWCANGQTRHNASGH